MVLLCDPPPLPAGQTVLQSGPEGGKLQKKVCGLASYYRIGLSTGSNKCMIKGTLEFAMSEVLKPGCKKNKVFIYNCHSSLYYISYCAYKAHTPCEDFVCMLTSRNWMIASMQWDPPSCSFFSLSGLTQFIQLILKSFDRPSNHIFMYMHWLKDRGKSILKDTLKHSIQ